MSSHVVVLSAALSLVTIAYYVHRWYRLRDFKGPWLASFSEIWLAKTALSGSFHNILMDTNKKYGPLTRIQHDILLTDDPEIISHMNAARSKHKKADWYTFMRFNPFIDNIFSERDLQAHDRLRAIMAPAYSTKQNFKLEQKITNGIQSFVQYIETRLSGPDQSCVLDFSKVAQYYTLDVITDMAFGKPFGYLAKDEDLHDYHATFAEQAPVISIINSMPSVARFLNQDWTKKIWAPTTKDTKGIGKLMRMAEDTVKVRLDSRKQDDDMLGSFLSHGMSPRQAEAEILTQLSAGTDSNSAALRGIFLHIITNPVVYSKLKQEIDSGIHDGKISSPVTAGEATDLQYLDACVREGMRIWPPFAGLNIKKVNDEGEVIKERFIPGGTGIAVSFWGIQRNPVFGEDVNVFRPDRWTEADKEQRARMDKVHDLVFGYGRWLCLGKSMVSMEIRQTIVELLRRFDFSVTNPTHPWNTTSYVFMLIEDMEVRITKRQTL